MMKNTFNAMLKNRPKGQKVNEIYLFRLMARVRNQLITLLPPSTRWAVVAYIENFVFFLFILDFIWKRLLICSDAWAENIPGGEYDLVKLPLPGSCGRVSFFYSEAL